MRGAILVLLGALGACAGRNPPAGARIEVGAARLELGSKDAPLRLAIHPYRQGAARGELWVAVVDPARAHLAVVPAPGGPMAIGEYGARGADFAAINGGFYDNEGAMGLVVSDGRLVHPVRKGGGSGVFYVAGGRPAIAFRDDVPAPGGLGQAVQSIDRLVQDGRVMVKPRPDLPHDARSAVALDAAGRLLLLAIFDERAVAAGQGTRLALGRRSSTVGPTLYEWAELLARPVAQGGFGAVAALNLDGGFSTAMRARIGGAGVELAGYRGTINCVMAFTP